MGVTFLFVLYACHEQRAKSTAQGRTVMDQLSRPITISPYPRRIVSMAPSVTEMLYALGVWDRVVGVTLYDTYPPDCDSRTRIGDMLRPNLEVILSLKPDLVVATVNGNYRGNVEKLQSLGIPVFVVSASHIEEILQSFRLLGDALNERSRADQVIHQMRRGIEQLRTRLAAQPFIRVLYLNWIDPIIVPGGDAFENEALALAKVDSLTRDLFKERYMRYSPEQIIRLSPEYILTVQHNAEGLQNILESRRWTAIPAVRKRRVYIVSDLIQHPSQRILEGIEEVARKLHPEAFGN
ncbi:MAG: ABC transporter substrate-binding protein [Acidobacteria bacterium]|nr:ABC transporter substrate-binding protein [Acidobacteriota bacterium]